eukprot:g16479.t1
MAKWFWAGALSIVVVASLVAPTRWRTPLAALAAACALALAWRPRTKAAVQQERYPKQYVARRGTVAPIDGDLEKAVWRLAPWSEPFSEIRGPDAPKGTQPRPEEATRVKMLWDDEYLYIAAVMDVDAGNELVALFKERNSPIFHTDSDFEVFLDPAGCCHGYKELEINALNTVWNLLLDRPYSDGGGEYSGRIAQKGEPRWWDVEKQKTAVKVTKGQIGFAPSKAQWCVEVALRHSESLSQAPQRGAEPSVGSFWRINFSRVERENARGVREGMREDREEVI